MNSEYQTPPPPPPPPPSRPSYIEPNKLIKGVRMPLILSISAINRL